MESRRYRIGEAARMLGLKTYVLRFWETEFPQIKPIRTEKGQRLYTDEHIELLRTIRHLLHEKGMTIDGAKKKLAETSPENSLIKEVRAELEEIRALLDNSASR